MSVVNHLLRISTELSVEPFRIIGLCQSNAKSFPRERLLNVSSQIFISGSQHYESIYMQIPDRQDLVQD